MGFVPTLEYRGRKHNDDDSDMQEEENLMTDAQKEEENMFKYTFNSFANGKMGVPLERYELPMILDGKLSSLMRPLADK